MAEGMVEYNDRLDIHALGLFLVEMMEIETYGGCEPEACHGEGAKDSDGGRASLQ